uniref:Intraflagellar transport protein 20 n=1 Tax=Fibrocapsa japonica TaxID=94617 RepID=A0A7S2V367_9STRA|mmetsp:Transcript_4950/g.7489  ORF Transcript_4950/g.7489 Transcript_4950/m.7489 type:complete len:132 (+) Transcript_4950:57-452(+)
MDPDKVSISFDDDYRIRVLDSEKYKHTEELEKECKEFVQKIQTFNTTVHTLVEVLDAQAKRIENAKLKAIGQRNQVEGEREHRERQRIALNTLIAEKKAELDRYTLQHQSLVIVEAEQAAMVERLTNNDMN